MGIAAGVQESLAAKFAALFPHLDERQRRLMAGAEARALGHGGIRVVARAAGMREGTVSRGVAELEAGQEPLGRARLPGGGRKRLAEVDPGLRPALLALVEPDMRGDPESPLRWTTKSLRVLAAELACQGHRASADTVADLLHEMGFSLQGNAKTVEGRQNPDRDQQFRYINEQARAHRQAGDPVVSVDTKKKELVGAYKNGGREWRPKGDPAQVSTHDYVDPELGKAIPYGIYDLAANTGWVNVGTDHDTAAFAVESIRRWWQARGQATYPRARRLLVTADAGGSNGYRTRAWQPELAPPAPPTPQRATRSHLPTGTSKGNPNHPPLPPPDRADRPATGRPDRPAHRRPPRPARSRPAPAPRRRPAGRGRHRPQSRPHPGRPDHHHPAGAAVHPARASARHLVPGQHNDHQQCHPPDPAAAHHHRPPHRAGRPPAQQPHPIRPVRRRRRHPRPRRDQISVSITDRLLASIHRVSSCR